MSNPALNQRGATLLELLVAAAILAIAAAGFFRLYSLGIAVGQYSERVTIAVGLAQARMEQLVSNLTGQQVWELTGGTTSSTSYRVTSEVAEEATGLRRATVTVSWM